MRISEIADRLLSIVDRIADFIPVVSTLTNLTGLFLKKVYIPKADMDDDGNLKSRYLRRLDGKSKLCTGLLSVPIVNVVVAAYIEMSNGDEEDYVSEDIQDPEIIQTQSIEKQNFDKNDVFNELTRLVDKEGIISQSLADQLMKGYLDSRISLENLKKIFKCRTHDELQRVLEEINSFNR